MDRYVMLIASDHEIDRMFTNPARTECLEGKRRFKFLSENEYQNFMCKKPFKVETDRAQRGYYSFTKHEYWAPSDADFDALFDFS